METMQIVSGESVFSNVKNTELALIHTCFKGLPVECIIYVIGDFVTRSGEIKRIVDWQQITDETITPRKQFFSIQQNETVIVARPVNDTFTYIRVVLK